ncbi:MAG: J domain-containing protein [Cytophagaceae bacterium]
MPLKRFLNILKANVNAGSSSGAKPVEPAEEFFHTEQKQADPMNKNLYQNPENKKEAEYYANLELAPGANFDQIKAAYKSLMKKYHPDLHNYNEESRKTAELITGRLNEAYSYFERKFGKG